MPGPINSKSFKLLKKDDFYLVICFPLLLQIYESWETFPITQDALCCKAKWRSGGIL